MYVARIDMTMPGRTNTPGTLDECVKIFIEQGSLNRREKC